jgi:type I restriction enzyme S subunit
MVNEWKKKKLGDIAEVRMCKRIFANQTTSTDEIPFYKIGTFGKEPDAFISRFLYNEYKSKYSFPNEGDILLSAAGTLGRTIVYDGKPAYFQDSNIVWLEIDKNLICNEYLTHCYQVMVWASPEGSTISRLYNGIIRDTDIILPSLPEQRTIAEAISNTDAFINAMEKFIAKKLDIKRGAMQELLTGKRRLLGFSGEWVEKKLGEIVDIYDNLRIPVAESLRTKGKIPYYGANGIQDYVDGYTHDGEFVLLAEDGANDLLNYPVNYVCGKIWVNNHAHVIRGINDIADTKYLSYALKTLDFQSVLVGGTRAKLNSSVMKELKITIAVETVEQTAIAAILSDMKAEIDALTAKLAKLRNIKQGMMSELLTGRIRLTVNEMEASANV